MSLPRPSLALFLLLVLTAGLTGCSPSSGAPDDRQESTDPGEASGPTTPAVSSPDVEPAPEPEPEDDEVGPRSPLTGESVEPALLAQPPLLAKIENSPQARPQSGLDQADVVYEELVEGGVTRFFAVFHSQLPAVAGPVRSARPVDVQLMGSYGRAVFAYSGAREEVRELLAEVPAVTITEGAPGFFRDPDRDAPHNLFLRPTEALEAVPAERVEPLEDVGWQFGPQLPEAGLLCSPGEDQCDGEGIEIPMSRSYVTGWEYDPGEEVYRRLQDGAPFLVEGDGRIGAANVVVLATEHYVGPTGYPETDLVTERADALVLRDGHRYRAEWSKPAVDAPLALRTVDGDPFPLAPGTTWVHLPPASVVEALLG